MRPAWALLGALLAAAPAVADEGGVVLFRRSTGALLLDDARLADAVRIYTRDLGIEWREEAAAADRVRLTVWYEARPVAEGEVAVTLFVLLPGDDPGRPGILRVRGAADDNLYRAIALKVRALVTGAGTAELEMAAPPERPPAPPRRLSGAVEIGYHLLFAEPADAFRHGLVLGGALRVGRIELGAAASLDTRIAREGPAGRAAAWVTPVWLFGRLVGSRGVFSGGAGVRAGLAIVSAEGAEDGRRGGSTQASALLGAEGIVRWHLSPHLALCAQLTIDLLLPRQRFTLDGREALDTGSFAAGGGVGLVVAIP